MIGTRAIVGMKQHQLQLTTRGTRRTAGTSQLLQTNGTRLILQMVLGTSGQRTARKINHGKRLLILGKNRRRVEATATISGMTRRIHLRGELRTTRGRRRRISATRGQMTTSGARTARIAIGTTVLVH